MKKKFIILTSLFILFALTACNTIKFIPEEKTSAQIIQMGQNACSVRSYKSAILCYETAIERFGTNPAVYAEAKYEIGYVYLKQKKYAKAYSAFTELLELYDAMGSAIPPAYKKLSEIGIEKIPENKRK